MIIRPIFGHTRTFAVQSASKINSMSAVNNNRQRIIIIGAGFAGLSLARDLNGTDYEVFLIDKHNYHQFQPLMYQVATARLEPSSISFPCEKYFSTRKM